MRVTIKPKNPAHVPNAVRWCESTFQPSDLQLDTDTGEIGFTLLNHEITTTETHELDYATHTVRLN